MDAPRVPKAPSPSADLPVRKSQQFLSLPYRIRPAASARRRTK